MSPYIYELSDLVDLFPGNEGEMTRDWDPNPAQSPAFFSPLEPMNVQLTTGGESLFLWTPLAAPTYLAGTERYKMQVLLIADIHSGLDA